MSRISHALRTWLLGAAYRPRVHNRLCFGITFRGRRDLPAQQIVPKFLLSVLLITIGLQASGAEPTAEPKNVLMVGNSLTYTYKIPNILERFAAETGRKLVITRHFAGGKDLTWHWDNTHKPDGLNAAEVIEEGDFDLVILQDSSRRSLAEESLKDFARITTEYHRLTEKKSIPMMFYMGFLRNERFPEDAIKTLSDMYTDQANSLEIRCAPVALAFLRCHKERPNLALLDNQTDAKYAMNQTGSHQSPFGSYLAACTLYAAIYDQSPVGLKFHAAFDRRNKEVPFEAADAAAAQDIAWRTWQEYRKSRSPKVDE